MKTIKKYIGQGETIIAFTLMTIVFFFISLRSSAIENTQIGFSLSNSVTGSGTGSLYTTSFTANWERSTVAVGVNLQKRNLNLSGTSVAYIFTPNPFMGDRGRRCEIFFYANMHYSHSAFLGKNKVKQEEFVSPESNVNFQEIKLRLIEEYVGFGINHHVVENLNFSASIGVGAFHTLNKHAVLYRDDNDACIQLKWGFSYVFGND